MVEHVDYVINDVLLTCLRIVTGWNMALWCASSAMAWGRCRNHTATIFRTAYMSSNMNSVTKKVNEIIMSGWFIAVHRSMGNPRSCLHCHISPMIYSIASFGGSCAYSGLSVKPQYHWWGAQWAMQIYLATYHINSECVIGRTYYNLVSYCGLWISLCYVHVRVTSLNPQYTWSIMQYTVCITFYGWSLYTL